MMAPLHRLIESLRNELQQYGEMLALLEHQRQAVMQQGAEDVLHSISSINAQNRVLDKARQIREDALSKLSRVLQQPDGSTFSQLIPLLPDPFRPLVTALVQENNALLQSVRQRAEQNHLLLQRSLDFMRDFISNLSPQGAPVSGLDGLGTAPATADPDSRYEAIA